MGHRAQLAGRCFFSDIDNQKIWKWSLGGGAETAVAGVWTHHLFVDAADNLYYETEIYQGEWGNSFWRLSPDGEQHDIGASNPRQRRLLGNTHW